VTDYIPRWFTRPQTVTHSRETIAHLTTESRAGHQLGPSTGRDRSRYFPYSLGLLG